MKKLFFVFIAFMLIFASGCMFVPSPRPLPGSNTLSRVDQKIKEASLDSIRLTTVQCTQDNLPLGVSRLGGVPDLPPGFVWPKWNGKSQSFIAQLDLAEMASFDASKRLPRKGFLYFFYNQQQDTAGFDPKDRTSWLVFYYDGERGTLSRTEIPSDVPEEACFQPCALTAEQETTLPPYDSLFIRSLGLNEGERAAYAERLDKALAGNDIINRLLGHPDVIQNEMQVQCQLTSYGLYTGDSSGYNDPRASSLKKGAGDWLLLLQVDSDENAGMMWGDAGRLYWWIKKSDLAARYFDQAWLVMQCY